MTAKPSMNIINCKCQLGSFKGHILVLGSVMNSKQPKGGDSPVSVNRGVRVLNSGRQCWWQELYSLNHLACPIALFEVNTQPRKRCLVLVLEVLAVLVS